jgi:hypothetical protein
MVYTWWDQGVLVQDPKMQFDEAGRIAYMNLNIADIDAMPEGLAHVEPGLYADGGGLTAFLNNWGAMYQKQTHKNWSRTGKEKSLAARVYAKCHHNADEATRLAYAFFHQPAEVMPDDVSFTSFYMSVDKMLAAWAQERKFEDNMRKGDRDAARRLIIDPEEEDRITAERLAIIERNRRLEEEEQARAAAQVEEVPIREPNRRRVEDDD